MESDDETFDDLEYYYQQVMWARIGSPPAPAGLDQEGLKDPGGNGQGAEGRDRTGPFMEHSEGTW